MFVTNWTVFLFYYTFVVPMRFVHAATKTIVHHVPLARIYFRDINFSLSGNIYIRGLKFDFSIRSRTLRNELKSELFANEFNLKLCVFVALDCFETISGYLKVESWSARKKVCITHYYLQ